MSDGRLDRAEQRLRKQVAAWSSAAGCPIEPRSGLVGERAALLGLPAPGIVSSNGACRLVRTLDGWLAVNLPRPEDRAMVPALLGAEIAADDPWLALEAMLPSLTVAQALEQSRLLGLAVTAVGETAAPARSEAASAPGRGRAWPRAPRVIDLSALWAGPLCGGLLAQAGCEVLKVDTIQRPDTTRARSAAFDDLLNGGKRRWRVDMNDTDDRARLADLLSTADVVVTSARPRAMSWLSDIVRRECCWIAICAHPCDPDRIGFGDDCAAAGGLVAFADGMPAFIGDATADPLAGLAAAATAFRALALRLGGRHDVALATVAAEAAHG